MSAIQYIGESGTVYWKSTENPKLFHREDGPAIQYPIGSQCWYLMGKLHREDGPAGIWRDLNTGQYTYEYFIHGKQYTEEEFKRHILKKNLQDLIK